MKIDSFELGCYIFLFIVVLSIIGIASLHYKEQTKAREQCEKYGLAFKESVPDGTIICYETLQDERGFTYKNEIKMVKEWKKN